MSYQDTTLDLLRDCKELKPYGSGKVREIFELPSYPNYLLVYVTDRWSARDFVFDFGIDGIGMVRNAMTIHAKKAAMKEGVKTDLVAYGRLIDEYLPAELKRSANLRKRATIVKKLEMYMYELIVRFNSVGGVQAAAEVALAAGKTEFEFCGNVITASLQFGSTFDPPLSTPTTKEAVGHDNNVDKQKVEDEHPGLLAFAAGRAIAIHDRLVREGRGNLIDIKFELGRDPVTGEHVLGDEVSPDSARFTSHDHYPLLHIGLKDRVDFLDKEFGRSWADKLGIKDYDPKNPEHRAIVAEWEGDEKFMKEFRDRYDRCFFMYTNGYTLAEYQKEVMNL